MLTCFLVRIRGGLGSGDRRRGDLAVAEPAREAGRAAAGAGGQRAPAVIADQQIGRRGLRWNHCAHMAAAVLQ